MNYIVEVVGKGVINILMSGSLIMLAGKLWAEHFLQKEKKKFDKEIEEYKKELEKGIEKIKSINEKALFRDKLLFELEFETYKNISFLINEIREDMANILPLGISDDNFPEHFSRHSSFCEKGKALKEIVNKNRPFISECIYEKTVLFIHALDDFERLTFVPEDGEKFNFPKIECAVKKIIEEANITIKCMREYLVESQSI